MNTDIEAVRLVRRYLIDFTPAGVPGEGWHRLEVRVKGRGYDDVNARAGCFRAPGQPQR